MLSSDAVIAVDIGGTSIKAAVCDAAGTAIVELRRATPVSAGIPAVVEAISAVIAELTAQTADSWTIRGVGLSLPGVVDAAAGIARYATNLGWHDLPIRDLIGASAGLPVAIEHDVRAAGIAELRLGAARGVSDALFVSVGTGISCAVIVGGQVSAGAGDQAGEIGHLPAFPDGEICACGQRGCAETYASAAALPRRFRALGGEGCQSAEQVIARAEAGDPIATAVFADAITALARMLVSCTLLLDPAVIVIGGGMSLAGRRLLDPLAERIQQGLTWRSAPKLVPAHFGADAGQVGAALLGWRACAGAEAPR